MARASYARALRLVNFINRSGEAPAGRYRFYFSSRGEQSLDGFVGRNTGKIFLFCHKVIKFNRTFSFL